MKTPNSIVQKSILKFVLPSILFLLPVSFAFIDTKETKVKVYDISDTTDAPPGAKGDVSGMFNERGYYNSNSVTFDENEIINDFNGNLSYSIPLFNMKGPGDIYMNISLNYNGSVNHQVIVSDPSAASGTNNLAKYNINSPEWIFSLNGMAVQLLNFETNFFTHPENPSPDSVVSNDNVRLLATGYQITDRVSSTSASERDKIFIMRGDGSVLTLKKISSCTSDSSFKNCYVGEYYSDNKNDYTRAVVKYSNDNSYPSYRSRTVHLMNGDGLTYIYEEFKNKYSDFPYNTGGLELRPQVFLLRHVKDRFGHQLDLNYLYDISIPLAGTQPIDGRPILNSIQSVGGWQGNSVLFRYSQLEGAGAITIQNYKSQFRIRMDNFVFTSNGNHRPMISYTINPFRDTLSFSYNQYDRTPYNLDRNFAQTSPRVRLILNLKRISSVTNYNGGKRIYTYADNNTALSIDMTPLNNCQILSNPTGSYYKGQGRDMFFTNMIATKKSRSTEADSSLESFTYSYLTSRNANQICSTPVDANDTFYTTRTIAFLDSTYNYGSPVSTSSKKFYRNYPLPAPPPVNPENYLGLKANIVDQSGHTTKLGYDDLLNQDSTANIDTSYTLVSDSYQTDVDNYFGTVYGFINKKIFRDEQGNKFEKYFDAVGNLRREVKFLDSSQIDAPMVDLTTDYRYDSAYRVSKVKTPQEKIIHYYYDGYGRQTKRITTDAGQTDFIYDKNDNLIFSQDANQRNADGDKYTFRNYDGLNRMTGTGEVIYEIDSPDDEIQYQGNTATYYLTVNVYDTLTNSVVNSLFSAPSGYDSESNFTQGNLVATAYRTRNTDNWNYKYYRYDVRGRVIKMWNIIDGLGTKIILYRYNSQNQITRVDYGESTEYQRFRYNYDAAGRLSSVDYYTDPATTDNPGSYVNLISYTYNQNSQIEMTSFANGYIDNDYYYNSRNWISEVSSKNDIFGYTNTYFKNGNVKTQSLSGSYNDDFDVSSDLTFTCAYDKSNRLLSSQISHSYRILNSFDKDGNLLTLKRYGGANGGLEDDFTYSYYSGTNKVSKVTGSTNQYTYDYNGNMITDNVNVNYSIQYDHRNLITQLRHLEDSTLYETKYYYDESGNRIKKQVYYIGSGFGTEEPMLIKEEVYVRDVSGKDLAIYIEGSLSQWNIFGLSNEGKISNGGGIYFYLKDHLGSVRAIVTDGGTLKSAQDYDAWGYLLTGRSINSEDSKYKFTEKERDDESKYDYFGARYYDPRIGRWGAVDPMLEKHYDFNPYNYVLNNPLYYIDPDGKQVYFTVWDAIKYTFVQTAKTAAPLVGVSLNPVGIFLGSLVSPSQLGQVAKYNEFIEEQRILIEELNPRYTTQEIIVNAWMSESGVDRLSDKKAKELANDQGFEGEKPVESLKEDALKKSGIPSTESGKFDIYKDKGTGKHVLKPKQKYEKQFKNKNIPVD